MGFDPLTQKTMRNSIVEYGEISFTTTGLTVEVPTRLRKVIINFGIIIDDNLVCSGDKTISEAGAVTFTRESGGSSGATFQYIMAGF